MKSYDRTPTQDEELGFQPIRGTNSGIVDDNGTTMSQLREEVMKFTTQCPHCRASTEINMCVTNIPHFKEVIMMCLLCEHCGYKSNEVKGGGGIPPFGTKITLHVTNSRDLSREVIKSDSAGIFLPDLDLEVEGGGLNGVYTSVEGLLKKMHDRLWDANPYRIEDSLLKQHADNDEEGCSSPRSKQGKSKYDKYKDFLSKLKEMADGQLLPFTLILSDPLSNSFVGPVVNAAESPQADESWNDGGLKIEKFKRTETLAQGEVVRPFWSDRELE